MSAAKGGTKKQVEDIGAKQTSEAPQLRTLWVDNKTCGRVAVSTHDGVEYVFNEPTFTINEISIEILESCRVVSASFLISDLRAISISFKNLQR